MVLSAFYFRLANIVSDKKREIMMQEQGWRLS